MARVSVIITTYKADNRLSEAIESVLDQTFNDFEIIVVDDNNPDTSERIFTETLLNRYCGYDNVQYIKHEKNKNGAAARNTGIKVARGEYIAFLDDDDFYLPRRLEKCVTILDENPEYNGVYTAVEVCRNGQRVKIRNPEESGRLWKTLLLNEGLLGTGSNIFIRKNSKMDFWGFDEEFQRYQDVEFMLRFLLNNSIFALDELLVRKNVKNLSNTNIPDYIKYKNNKELIFRKFKSLIEQLSVNEQRGFFQYHYLSLYNAAILSGNRKYINESRQSLGKTGYIFGLKDNLRAIMPRLYKSYLYFRTRDRRQ